MAEEYLRSRVDDSLKGKDRQGSVPSFHALYVGGHQKGWPRLGWVFLLHIMDSQIDKQN